MTRHNFELLERINSLCQEIQQSLLEHLASTTNIDYITQIEKDIVTLENLKAITVAVKTDLEQEKVGACTELLLRIAANDFKNKLARIPEKKTLRLEVSSLLNEVHRNLLRMIT